MNLANYQFNKRREILRTFVRKKTVRLRSALRHKHASLYKFAYWAHSNSIKIYAVYCALLVPFMAFVYDPFSENSSQKEVIIFFALISMPVYVPILLFSPIAFLKKIDLQILETSTKSSQLKESNNFILYLRPLYCDQYVKFNLNKLTFWIHELIYDSRVENETVDELLYRSSQSNLPVVKLGPNRNPRPGVGSIHSGNDLWTQDVDVLIAKAKIIIMIPLISRSAGTYEEVRIIQNNYFWDKVTFIMPPEQVVHLESADGAMKSHKVSELWDESVKMMSTEFAIDLPSYDASGAVIPELDRPLKWVNGRYWSSGASWNMLLQDSSRCYAVLRTTLRAATDCFIAFISVALYWMVAYLTSVYLMKYFFNLSIKDIEIVEYAGVYGASLYALSCVVWSLVFVSCWRRLESQYFKESNKGGANILFHALGFTLIAVIVYLDKNKILSDYSIENPFVKSIIYWCIVLVCFLMYSVVLFMLRAKSAVYSKR